MSEVKSCRCKRCDREMYRTDGQRVLVPSDGTMAIRPVDLTIGSTMIVQFCSSECAARWFSDQPTEHLLYGYRLFPL